VTTLDLRQIGRLVHCAINRRPREGLASFPPDIVGHASGEVGRGRTSQRTWASAQAPSTGSRSRRASRRATALGLPQFAGLLAVTRSTSSDVAIRYAVPDDATPVAQVHVRAWQVAYRGLLPAAYLDTLRFEDRAARYTLRYRHDGRRAVCEESASSRAGSA
jgi:hypothetical protein